MDRAYGTLIKVMFCNNGLKPIVKKWPSLWLFKKMIYNGLVLASNTNTKRNRIIKVLIV